MTQLPVTASPDERWFAHRLVQVETAAASKTLTSGTDELRVNLPVVPRDEMWLLESSHTYVIFGNPTAPGVTTAVDIVIVAVIDGDVPASLDNEVALFGQIADTSSAQPFGSGDTRQWSCAINRAQPVKIPAGHHATILLRLRTTHGAALTEAFVRAQFMRLRRP